jgi:hypothetical protein
VADIPQVGCYDDGTTTTDAGLDGWTCLDAFPQLWAALGPLDATMMLAHLIASMQISFARESAYLLDPSSLYLLRFLIWVSW